MSERIEKVGVTLGEHLQSIIDAEKHGSDPGDGCINCGRKQVILHPVGRTWACSDCHTPEQSVSDGGEDE